MFDSFVTALLLSLGLILPLGAQNLFVFQQGILQSKFNKTLPTVLTASICDTILISASVMFGTFLINLFPSIIGVLYIISILFISFIGYKLWTQHIEKTIIIDGLSRKHQISATLALSVLNPHVWLDTFGVIGTQAMNFHGNEKLIFTVTCITVSWFWFFFLAFSGHIFKIFKLNKYMRLLNKISALILWIIAIKLLISLVS